MSFRINRSADRQSSGSYFTAGDLLLGVLLKGAGAIPPSDNNICRLTSSRRAHFIHELPRRGIFSETGFRLEVFSETQGMRGTQVKPDPMPGHLFTYEPCSAYSVGLPSPTVSTLVPSTLLAILAIKQCFLPMSPHR